MLERLRTRTLRGRLMLFLLLPLIPLVLYSLVADYRAATRITNDVYDNALASAALALASRLERTDDDKQIEVDVPPAAEAILRSDRKDRLYYVVVNTAGAIIAGNVELLAFAKVQQANRVEFKDGALAEHPVRVATYRYQSPTLTGTVVVAQTLNQRTHSAAAILGTVLWSNLALLVAAVVLVYFGVRYAMRPLDELSDSVARRPPNDFSALPPDVPGELRPFTEAVNRLMSHLRKAGSAQQSFLSNASHQLRTPLAALQTQLELAGRSLPSEHAERMNKLLDSTQRLTHFTHQMLALARSAPEAGVANEERMVDLRALMEAVGADHVDSAVRKRIDLGFDVEDAAAVGSQWMLRELIANLLDNAIVYSPAGSRVTGRTRTDASGCGVIEVNDDGPGIAPDERERVFERFYRPRDTVSDGSGLGLAIVREVAVRHGAQVAILDGDGGKGTCVRVSFPHIKQFRHGAPQSA